MTETEKQTYGNGKRVKKIVPTTGETTIVVYDASGRMAAEYSTVVASASVAQVSYLTNDHLGSPRITTDKDGDVYSRRDFMPFGEEIDSDHTAERASGLNYGEDGLRQKFTSYERDDETELDYAQARMYQNSFGRFTSPDPLHASANAGRPQSWNRYLYVENSPVNFTDPTGLSRCFDAECSGYDDGGPLMSAGEIRYDSILNNGYDPAFNRFVGEVTISFTTGVTGLGVTGGTVVLQRPTLDAFLDAYGGVVTTIINAQEKKVNELRRKRAKAGAAAAGFGRFIGNETATEKEGINFEVRNVDNFQKHLKALGFVRGSLFGSHAEALGCNEPDAKCTEFRSKKGSFGEGSLQVVINMKTGRGYYDEDRFNPYQFPIGTFGHLFELLGPNVPGAQVNFNRRRQSDLVDRLSKVRAAYNQGR